MSEKDERRTMEQPASNINSLYKMASALAPLHLVVESGRGEGGRVEGVGGFGIGQLRMNEATLGHPTPLSFVFVYF